MHDIVYDDILCIISCNYTFQSGCVTHMHADVCRWSCAYLPVPGVAILLTMQHGCSPVAIALLG